MAKINTILGIVLFVMGCTSSSPTTTTTENVTDKPQSTSHPITSDIFPISSGWADSVIQTLSIRQQIAQLVFPRIYGYYTARDDDNYSQILTNIKDYEVGGLVIFQGDVFEQAAILNDLQAVSNLPLWVMQDVEYGLAMRVNRATRFPHMMALGAIDDVKLTRNVARAIARESKAVGVHQVLAPVVDINNNPENPVINVRSFGALPDLVARHGLAYSQGIMDEGLMPTPKHFPGHGDTYTDSHLYLPVINHSVSRLDSVELKPYKMQFDHHVPSVMISHVAFPSIGEPDYPATLSKSVLDLLLFEKFNFKGLVVSDAMDMGAIINQFGAVSASTLALNAGVDILIVPPDVPAVIEGLVEKVYSGVLDSAFISKKVYKLLLAKENARLQVNRFSDLDKIRDVVANKQHKIIAEEVARRSITLLGSHNQLKAKMQNKGKKLLLVLSDFESPDIYDFFLRQLRDWGFKNYEIALLDKRSNPFDYEKTSRLIRENQNIVITSYLNVVSGKNDITFNKEINDWITQERDILKTKDVSLIAFGNPYIINNFNYAKTAILTYTINPFSEKVLAEMIMKGIAFSGELPIELDVDTWITSSSQSIVDEAEGSICRNYPAKFQVVDTLIHHLIADSVSPSFSLSVFSADSVYFSQSYGHQTYNPLSPLVTCQSLYDLASLTKAMSTTLAMMKLYEQGKISLEDELQQYFKILNKDPKGKITIKNLLKHQSGLMAWYPFHKNNIIGKDRIIEFILKSGLQYTPGDSTVYSDFNFILLGQIVELVSGEPLDLFVQHEIYEKMQLTRLTYNPFHLPLSEIVPTEIDNSFRKRTIHRIVHDETAYLMGGVAGHAGLFGSVEDLTKLGQMLLANGRYEGIEIFSSKTVELFQSRLHPKDKRALGFDLKAKGEFSSAGTQMSDQTYGHLGFTGTSFWLDPENKVGIILLSNRVFPTRDNQKIQKWRPFIHDQLMHLIKKD